MWTKNIGPIDQGVSVLVYTLLKYVPPGLYCTICLWTLSFWIVEFDFMYALRTTRKIGNVWMYSTCLQNWVWPRWRWHYTFASKWQFLILQYQLDAFSITVIQCNFLIIFLHQYISLSLAELGLIMELFIIDFKTPLTSALHHV